MIRDGRYIDLSKRVVIRGQKKEKKNIYIYIKGTYEKKNTGRIDSQPLHLYVSPHPLLPYF